MGYKLLIVNPGSTSTKIGVYEDEKELCDVEQEFLCLMDKYSIPYVYDRENEMYTIYGYK